MHEPHRRARVRPEHYRAYPATYHGQWFPVVERHNPDVPVMPGYVLNLLGVAAMLGSLRTVVKPFSLHEMVKVVHQEISR